MAKRFVSRRRRRATIGEALRAEGRGESRRLEARARYLARYEQAIERLVGAGIVERRPIFGEINGATIARCSAACCGHQVAIEIVMVPPPAVAWQALELAAIAAAVHSAAAAAGRGDLAAVAVRALTRVADAYGGRITKIGAAA